MLPERLLRLYEDKSAIQAVGFQLDKPGKNRWLPKRWQVYCFEPLDLESLNICLTKKSSAPVFALPPLAAAPGIGLPPPTSAQRFPGYLSGLDGGARMAKPSLVPSKSSSICHARLEIISIT